jgi:predicted nuclease with TOPRIM domain
VLEYLREARREAVQLKEKSMSNNVKLQGQGERLDSLQDKVETINGVTVKIEENTKELSSFWYYLKVRVKNLLGFKGEEK